MKKEKKKRGPKLSYTPETVARIMELRSQKMIFKDIAEIVNMHPQTVFRIAKEASEVKRKKARVTKSLKEFAGKNGFFDADKYRKVMLY